MSSHHSFLATALLCYHHSNFALRLTPIDPEYSSPDWRDCRCKSASGCWLWSEQSWQLGDAPEHYKSRREGRKARCSTGQDWYVSPNNYSPRPFQKADNQTISQSQLKDSDAEQTVFASRCGMFPSPFLTCHMWMILSDRWKDMRMRIIIGIGICVLLVVIIVPIVKA